MNAAGMIFALSGVSAVMGMPFYQSLVTDGSISQDELDGTRNNLSAVITTLKKTPLEKIEALVSQYDDVLTEQLDKFNSVGQLNYLDGFKHAQIMAGYVTTIMAKAGLKE